LPGFPILHFTIQRVVFWYTANQRAVVFSDKQSREATANMKADHVGCLQIPLNGKRPHCGGRSFFPVHLCPLSVREMQPKAAKVRQSRVRFSYCFVGFDWLVLLGVAGEIRLRTRRPGVRISQGAPFTLRAGASSPKTLMSRDSMGSAPLDCPQIYAV
jgi:hypothetical protein